MPLISITEIINLLIVTAVVGYIFMGILPRTRPLYFHRRFDWNAFKFACLVSAPGIIIHELAHKFVAIYYGLQAAFSILPFGLFLSVFLKLINSPFILIAPGYVGISGDAAILESTFIAFAGPFTNLVLWLGSSLILNRASLTKKQAIALYLTKQINMWLFIFNMIPIPPLDGSKVFYGLFRIIFG